MKDLTTRKIVFGMLMALVLALGVQGTVEAIGDPAIDIADLSTRDLTTNNTIAITSLSAPDVSTVRESLSISVSGGGANFPHPTIANRTVTSYTWTETDTTNDPVNDPIDHNDGSITYPTGGVTITVRSPGIVRVTVSYTNSSATSATRNASIVRTYYVVKAGLAVNFDDTVSLLSADKGVGARVYNNEGHVKVHTGDGKNNPVTYTHTAGTLYVRYSNLYRDSSNAYIRSVASGTALVTSSSADVWLAMGTDSSTVTAKVTNGTTTNTRVYIHGRPTLKITTPTPPSPLEGDPGEVTTSGAVVVTVNDQATTGLDGGEVANVPVKFDVSDKTDTGGYLIPASTPDTNNPGFSSNIVDVNNNPIRTADVPASAKTLYVRTTGTTPTASVGFQFGTVPGTSEVAVSVSGRNISLSEKVKVQTGGVIAQLSISSNKRRSGNSNLFDLVASVTQNDAPLRGAKVTFHTGSGLLTRTPTGDTAIFDPVVETTDSLRVNSDANTVNGPLTGRQVVEITDRLGLAQVTYDLGDNTDRQEIDASIYDMDDSATADINESTLRQEVTFVVNGPADTTGAGAGSGAGAGTATNAITIAPATITGEPGDTVTITISNPTGAPVFLSSPSTADFPQTSFVPASGTTTSFTSTVTLPDREDTYTIFASTTTAGVTAGSATVTVATAAKGTLAISGETSGTPGSQITVTVTATDATGTREVGVDFTISAASIATTRGTTGANGIGRAIVTLPSTVSTYSLTARADGYTDRPFSVTVSTTGQAAQQPAPPPTPPSTVSEPNSIKVSGPATRSGTVNEALEAPLLAQVLDDDDNGVTDVSVIFRVTAGRGRLSQRGNGRAVGVRTDSRGYARAEFTPLSTAPITVEAEVRGVTEKASFTITTSLAPATIEPGTEDPMPSTTVSPVLNAGVPAASRPPMLWISGGKIYALVGSDVEVFIPTVENATNLTVGGGKVYWTAKTSETHGTLNSANLDGTDAKQLRTVWGVPRGITLDPTGSKLYWVDAAGRLQRSNLDASGIENVIRGLSDPKHVALSGGNAYWIGNGSGIDTLSFTNLSDPRKEIRPIASTSGISSGIYGGLTIVGSKLYWTEQTSDTHGTLYSANLDGTGIKELPDEPIWGAPVGIAVDTARSRLYWTDAVGRLQRSNLDASGIHNVAKGLGRLGDLVISNSIAEPAQTPSTKPPPTASKSKYDLNGDGVVDNTDAGLVSQALNTTNAKYDVNDDGVVNFFDLILVFDNRDAEAAGAPPLLGMKLTPTQIGIIEEQIDLLIATGDRSPAAMRTLIYLQQLLATARPEKTQLLANYPNPFNPETWIPYELVTDTDVRITIYNAQGVVIRTLQLGQQSAGYYTDRERAAYWDGRNALGEQVASGIYFYQFETDEMSSMRKMVILK